MTKIVISQPMFFPWVGMFEQINLADIYIHYEDTQFSKGSLVNRVQIKTLTGSKWLTVPLKNAHLGQLIKDVEINYQQDWRSQHLKTLKEIYHKSPFSEDMLDIVENTYFKDFAKISNLNIFAIELVCKYFDISRQTEFMISSQLGLNGKNSQRVLDMVKFTNGKIYITGHGARNYLQHEDFEQNNIKVEYMDYQKNSYPQLFGEFNPYVSILDLIANLGKAGKNLIRSATIDWKEFLKNE